MTKENPFIRYIDDSMIMTRHRNYSNELYKDNTLKFISYLLDYGPWHTHFKNPIDIFQYIDKKDIKRLKKNKETYFLFDCSLEGFSQHIHPHIDVLYYNCKKYNIPYYKIIYATSNLKDREFLEAYNKKNNITNGIKIFDFIYFKTSTHYLGIEHPYYRQKNIKMLEVNKKLTNELYQGKYFLSLSRIKRNHRILANFLLHSHNLTQYGLCSQASMTPHEEIHHEFSVNTKDFQKFIKTTPWIVDTKDFDTNHGPNLNRKLYGQTLFEIANETIANNYNNTSLFYSEKTFKPILNLQPFFIFGQQYCNQKLEDYGFKLYRNHFNYDFDSEPDTYRRYIKIIAMLKDIVIRLDNMNREEQIDWKYQSEEILLHNLKVLKDERYEKKHFLNLYNQIKQEL